MLGLLAVFLAELLGVPAVLGPLFRALALVALGLVLIALALALLVLALGLALFAPASTNLLAGGLLADLATSLSCLLASLAWLLVLRRLPVATHLLGRLGAWLLALAALLAREPSGLVARPVPGPLSHLVPERLRVAPVLRALVGPATLRLLLVGLLPLATLRLLAVDLLTDVLTALELPRLLILPSLGLRLLSLVGLLTLVRLLIPVGLLSPCLPALLVVLGRRLLLWLLMVVGLWLLALRLLWLLVLEPLWLLSVRGLLALLWLLAVS